MKEKFGMIYETNFNKTVHLTYFVIRHPDIQICHEFVKNVKFREDEPVNRDF